MATRKDQLDAFNFARRRMVANIVVPTATGSDEGAPRPVKTFATSIILSAIAVAAVAVLGVFKPSAPSGWQAGLAVDSNTGAAYITQNNELHAVYNITSARLVLGSKFQKFDVPDSTLNGAGISIGSPVGILGAPEDVPSSGNVNLKQWSFCQNEKEADESQPGGSTYLEIGYWPTADSTPQGQWTGNGQGGNQGANYALIVHDGQNNVYLVDGDYKYLVGNDTTDQQNVQNLLVAVNQNRKFVSANVVGFYVSDAWLSAFETGANITYPTVDNLGDAAPSGQPGSKIGTYGQNSGINSDGSVQTAEGLAQLSPFAYYLYSANSALADHGVQAFTTAPSPSEINAANNGHTPNNQDVFEQNTYGSNWPQIAPSLVGTDTQEATTADICVGYTGVISGQTPQLTTWTSAQLPYGTPSQNFGLSQTSSDSAANVVLVKPGYGLIAQRASGGLRYLIEDSGYRYGLAVDNTPNSSGGASSGSGSSSSISAIELLGYQDAKVETVPDNWLNLVQGGATLDPLKAGQTPGTGN